MISFLDNEVVYELSLSWLLKMLPMVIIFMIVMLLLWKHGAVGDGCPIRFGKNVMHD